MRRVVIAVVLLLVMALLANGCVYFNTFYHAKKAYKEGEAVRKRSNNTSAGKNHYERAIEKASLIAERHPKSKYHDDALFMMGRSYFHIGSYLKAENAFRRLLATHPESDLVEESQLYLARCRMELGDEQAGFRTFTELAETARKDEWRAEALYQRGMFFFRGEVYDSANFEYQRILNEYPNSDRGIDSRIQAARSLRYLGRPEEAIELYRPLTKDDDPDRQYIALMGISKSYYESGSPDSGVAILSVLLDDERFEDSVGVIRLALARGLQDLGDYSGAWLQYEQVAAAFEGRPWAGEAYFRMAEIKQFQDQDLVAAKELYDQSRQEKAMGDLAQMALARSAYITALEQFRIELGRGGLERARNSVLEGNYHYDPERLPRLERMAMYSTIEARPADYVAPLVVNAADSAAGSATTENPARAGFSSASAMAQDGEGKALGPPTSLALFYGPPVSQADIVSNRRRTLLLTNAVWHSLQGVDSALGPASPAYLYEFGSGSLLGPATPPDSVLAQWASALVDTAAERMKAEREAVLSERRAELEAIKISANTQLQLAELYRFSLLTPDSALAEYKDLVERYPNTPYAAKALLGAADVLANDLDDTAAANAQLRRILTDYPYSDYAGEAIARLGLEGTPADTAYPALVYRQAEDLYLSETDPQRAISALEDFISRYPDSRLVPNAEFAIATLTEKYFPREDSSLLLVYQDIQSHYPNSPFAEAAAEKLTFTVARPARKQRKVVLTEEQLLAQAGGTETGAADSASTETRLPRAPRPKRRGVPVFPETEIGSYTQKLRIVYKILINFNGEIDEYEVLEKTDSPDINASALAALTQTTFWADSIPVDSLNMWYRYDITITPPAREQDEWKRLGIPQNPLDRNRGNNP